MANDPSKKPTPLSMIAGAAGAVAGYAVARYAGPMVWIPLGRALLTGFIAARLVGPSAEPMVPAFAFQAGQTLWMLFGAFYTGQYQTVLADLIILAIGLTWLLARPGLGPVVLLGIYQGVSIAVNAAAFASAPAGSVEHKALLVHLVFRAAAIVLMFVGLRQVLISRPAEGTMDEARDEPPLAWDEEPPVTPPTIPAE